MSKKTCPQCGDKGDYYSDHEYASTFWCRNGDCRVASFDTVSMTDAKSSNDD